VAEGVLLGVFFDPATPNYMYFVPELLGRFRARVALQLRGDAHVQYAESRVPGRRCQWSVDQSRLPDALIEQTLRHAEAMTDGDAEALLYVVAQQERRATCRRLDRYTLNDGSHLARLEEVDWLDLALCRLAEGALSIELPAAQDIALALAPTFKGTPAELVDIATHLSCSDPR
jgi:hypothetical protein